MADLKSNVDSRFLAEMPDGSVISFVISRYSILVFR